MVQARDVLRAGTFLSPPGGNLFVLPQVLSYPEISNLGGRGEGKTYCWEGAVKEITPGC